MAEYKPKLKDVALAAQTAGRQAEHAIDGVRELREKITNIEKHIAVIDDKVFKKMQYEAGELKVDNDTYNRPKLDSSIHIELATFAKNKCPHCGSHNLHFAFDPDAFSDSTVNCRDCHNSWKVGGCAEDIDSPYEVANILRSEHRTLFEENKHLQEVNEKLKKQAAIDASYMVTVEDLMARIKSREDRIEALKLDNESMKMSIDEFISEKNDCYLMNSRLEEQCHKLEEEKDLLVKALNIYQKYMIVDVFSDGVTIFRLDNPDGIGRIIVNDPEVVKTLTNTWIRFNQQFKYHDVNDDQPKKKYGETKCDDYNCCKSCPLRMANCRYVEGGTLYEILDKSFERDNIDKDNPIYKAFRAELDKEIK